MKRHHEMREDSEITHIKKGRNCQLTQIEYKISQ